MQPSQLERYQDGWSAIYKLIDQGGSWSGRERNCCFLNTGDQRFADVSAATGLDFDDDGRAVAVVDWDFDGQLDLWVTNRTAPRVRFLRNATRGEHNFLAVRLEGVTCNRDAIGARLELSVGGETRIKTLHAGDGYLSQSSKWIHFGLGDASRIESLVVRWPGQAAETFTQLEVNQRYKLVQGTGESRRWTPPRKPIEPAAAPAELPASTSRARTWILGRLPLPDATYIRTDGSTVDIATHTGTPLLINLWSSSCSSCLQEMAGWTREEAALRKSGLNIISACVDQLSLPAQEASALANSALEKIGFPFMAGAANPDLVHAMEAIQRFYFERQQSLPIPSSFLLDRQGDVAAIYKGPVSAHQLLADLKLLDASPLLQRDAAVPFPGRWDSKLSLSRPEPLVDLLIGAGQHDEAMAYLRKYLARKTKVPRSISAAWHGVRAGVYQKLGDLSWINERRAEALEAYIGAVNETPGDIERHIKLADRLMLENDPDAALLFIESALKLNPGDQNLRFRKAISIQRKGQLEEAITLLRAIVLENPRAVAVHFHLAEALQTTGNAAEAVTHYRMAHQLAPNSPATQRLAWLLATHPDRRVRKGQEAVLVAEQLCEATRYRDAAALSALGASYAEVGRFEEAIRVASTAVTLASDAGDQKLVGDLQEQISLYRSESPFRGSR